MHIERMNNSERYQVAHAAGTDAGNRHMRKERRTTWNEEDYDIAAETFHRVAQAIGFPTERAA